MVCALNILSAYPYFEIRSLMGHNPIVSQRTSVLVSFGCGKCSGTWWLRVTQIYFLILLEGRHSNSISLGWNKGIDRTILVLQALGENLLLVSSSFWWLLASPGLWPHHSISVSMVALPVPIIRMSVFSASLLEGHMCLVFIQVIQDNLLNSWSLTNVCNLIFWHKNNLYRLRGWGRGYIIRDHF